MNWPFAGTPMESLMLIKNRIWKYMVIEVQMSKDLWMNKQKGQRSKGWSYKEVKWMDYNETK